MCLTKDINFSFIKKCLTQLLKLMSGIYVHIPFCKSKCYYCDFYSIVLTSRTKYLKDEFLSALLRELELQKNFFAHRQIDTIYFGGGTPSLFSAREINEILEKIFSLFPVRTDAEITLEVNPDDFSVEFARALKRITPVNRLSIGVQSFVDKDLQVLGRRHDAHQADSAVITAQDIGFQNISIDFIYGIPGSVDPFYSMELNLSKFYSLHLPHLSAYTLTIEPETVFGKWQRMGKLKPIDDDTFARLYETITKSLIGHDYLHYEISNYAKQGFLSGHNFSYWTGEPYLGVGPAAHSFGGDYRYWNIANIEIYLKEISQNKTHQHKEKLSERDKFNEYIMTHLRTYQGIDTEYLKQNFSTYYQNISQQIEQFEQQGFLYRNKQGNFALTMRGKLIADSLIAELFV